MTYDEAITAAKQQAVETQLSVSVWRHTRDGRYIVRAEEKTPPNEELWARVLTLTAQGAAAVMDLGTLQHAIVEIARRWRAVQQIPGATAVADALAEPTVPEVAFIQTTLADAGCFLSPDAITDLLAGGS